MMGKSVNATDILIRNTYFAIKDYIEDESSANRGNLWTQKEVLRSYLLTQTDLTIEKEMPPVQRTTSYRTARKSST